MYWYCFLSVFRWRSFLDCLPLSTKSQQQQTNIFLKIVDYVRSSKNARNNHVHATCTKLEDDGKPCRIKVGAIDAAALGS